MVDPKPLIPVEHVEKTILVIRDKRIILDSDLAKLYGVTTKRLNEQVKRNRDRFPEDFMFQLKTREKAEVVANCDHLSNLKFSRALPYAFTEHGAIMAASVLNTPRAIEASVFVVRAFVKMREMLIEKRDLAKKLAVLEEKLTERLDIHETAIVEVLKQVLALLNPPQDPPTKPKRKIGFEAKEPKACPVKFLSCEMPALLNVGPIPLGFNIFHRGRPFNWGPLWPKSQKEIELITFYQSNNK